MAASKTIHTAVLDTGAIIKNEPSVSTLLSKAESLVTVPPIISEIKDAATRSRVETTLRPFLTIRSPSPKSMQFVREFARKTGDLAVLSRPDLEIIALAYEIECERNGGDWRLRRAPGQQGLNGAAPSKEEKPAPAATATETNENASGDILDQTPNAESSVLEQTSSMSDKAQEPTEPLDSLTPSTAEPQTSATSESTIEALHIDADKANEDTNPPSKTDSAHESAGNESDESDSNSDSDGGGWITPSNLKKKQATDAAGSASAQANEEGGVMQVAVLTTDFAMQNVLLQINLNLVSPALTRVQRLRSYVLRCHACFHVCRDTSKQFCPRCGGATLTRVACSTNAQGEFRLHLKKNMQWSHRGDRYSIPKPVHGSANGRIKGGGKGGWGHGLILAEDQKEYQNAVWLEKKQRGKDLMDDDYLPGILTGDRGKSGGRVRVGAGRNVNSRKR